MNTSIKQTDGGHKWEKERKRGREREGEREEGGEKERKRMRGKEKSERFSGMRKLEKVLNHSSWNEDAWE